MEGNTRPCPTSLSLGGADSLEGALFLRGWPQSFRPRQVLHFRESHGISESRGEVGTGPLLDRGGSGESG